MVLGVIVEKISACKLAFGVSGITLRPQGGHMTNYRHYITQLPPEKFGKTSREKNTLCLVLIEHIFFVAVWEDFFVNKFEPLLFEKLAGFIIKTA